MKSKDLMQAELKENLVQAFKSDDENAIALAFAAFAESIQKDVLDDVKAYQQSADSNILAKRGIQVPSVYKSQPFVPLSMSWISRACRMPICFGSPWNSSAHISMTQTLSLCTVPSWPSPN